MSELSREQQKYDIEKQKNELILNNLLAKEYIEQFFNEIQNIIISFKERKHMKIREKSVYYFIYFFWLLNTS